MKHAKLMLAMSFVLPPNPFASLPQNSPKEAPVAHCRFISTPGLDRLLAKAYLEDETNEVLLARKCTECEADSLSKRGFRITNSHQGCLIAW